MPDTAQKKIISKNPCWTHAQSAYRRVNEMISACMGRVMPLVSAGAEIPDTFASTAEWKAMEDKIDAAIAANDLRLVKELCADYRKRAAGYIERFEARFQQEAA